MPARDSEWELATLRSFEAPERITQAQAQKFLGMGDPLMARDMAQIVSARVVNHATTYHWQDVGVTMQLAEAGYGINDPVTRELASAAAAQQFEQSDTLSESIWADADPGEALFDGGNFVGYSNLEREANDTLLSAIEQGADNGTVDRDEIYGHIRDGVMNPLEILAETDELNKPYEQFAEMMEGALQGQQSEKAEKVLRAGFNLPRDVLEELVAEANTASNLMTAVNEVAIEEWGNSWMAEGFVLGEDDTNGAVEALQTRLDDAARARGEDVPDDGGGRLRGAIGAVTRPVTSSLMFTPQLLTNRFRQNVSDLGTGVEGLQAQAMLGETSVAPRPATAGAAIGSPTLAAATQAATGFVGTTADFAAAATTFAPATFATRATVGLVPDLVEAAANTERFAERAAATDLGVMITDPDAAGDGILLSSDAVMLRQERERALSPAFHNGDLLTFGRAAATMLGTNPGTDAYNALSGAVDFAVAIRGPGEVVADATVAGIRNARALPGLREVAVVGNQDPLRAAGGIGSGWRNTVLRASADEWLTGSRGLAVAEALADMDSPTDVYRAFRGRIGVNTANEIARAADPSEVSSLMRLHMGREIGAVPRRGVNGTLRNANTWATRNIRDRSPFLTRMLTDVPATDKVNIWDIDTLFAHTDDYLKNASIPVEDSRELLDGLARTTKAERLSYMLNNIEGMVQGVTGVRLFERNWRSLPAVAKRTLDRFGVGDREALIAKYTSQAEEVSRSLTRHWDETVSQNSLYFADEVGRPAHVSSIELANGQVVEVPQPHLVIEGLNGNFPMPGINALRDLRRINSGAAQFLSALPMHWDHSGEFLRMGGAGRIPIIAMEAITQQIWKPLVLLRGAYVMRVVGEEQVRIAAAGGDSLINNPAGWFAWAMSGNRAGRALGARGRNMDILGGALDEGRHFDGVLVGDPKRSLRPTAALQRARTEGYGYAQIYRSVPRGDAQFVNAWAGEMSQLASDPLSAAVALRADGITDDLVRTVMDDEVLRAQLSIAEEMGTVGVIADDAVSVRNYLETLNHRIEIKTNGNTDLRQAIGTGKLGEGDDAINLRRAGSPGTSDASDEFIEAVMPLADEFAPDAVKGLRSVAAGSPLSEGVRVWKATMDILSGAIIERPSSFLSRSPVFRQNYWNWVADNASVLRADDARRLLDDIPAGLPRDLRRTLRFRLETSIAENAGTMGREGFDFAAKATAMQQTNDLLFSMVTKQQWADAARVIAPFASAWAEIITTWSKLLTSNPNVIRRVSQTRTVLADPDFADTLDAIPGYETIDGSGMLFTNDYGNEMVVIPWASAAGDLLRNTAGRLRGAPQTSLAPTENAVPLASLNVGASVLPGIGPAFAIPLARILPENFKGFDVPVANAEIRELLFPFGEPTDDVFDLTAVADEFYPSWMRHAQVALTGDAGSYATAQEAAGYAGRVISHAQWLAANDRSGRYDMTVGGTEARNRLIEDAKKATDESAYVVMASSWLGPAPTQTQFFVLDEDGKVQLNTDDPNGGSFLTVTVAGNLYRQFLDDATEHGMPFDDAQNAALLKLIEAGGTEGSIMSVIGKSRTVIPGGAPVTKEAWDWFQENPRARDEAQLTWGLFAPDDPDDEFYMPMYLEGIAQGDRKRLTIEEWTSLSEDVLGDYLYGEVLRDVEAEIGVHAEDFDDAMIDALADYRTEVSDRLPGWRGQVIGERGDATDAANELRRVTAPGAFFADHELATPIQRISEVRQGIIDAVRDEGISNAEIGFVSAKGARPYREAYDSFLTEMEQEYPFVSGVVERVFRAEMRSGLLKDVESREEDDG